MKWRSTATHASGSAMKKREKEQEKMEEMKENPTDVCHPWSVCLCWLANTNNTKPRWGVCYDKHLDCGERIDILFDSNSFVDSCSIFIYTHLFFSYSPTRNGIIARLGTVLLLSSSLTFLDRNSILCGPDLLSWYGIGERTSGWYSSSLLYLSIEWRRIQIRIRYEEQQIPHDTFAFITFLHDLSLLATEIIRREFSRRYF